MPPVRGSGGRFDDSEERSTVHAGARVNLPDTADQR